MRVPKSLLVQVIVTGVIAFAFGWFFGATSFYHIRSFDQAFTEYIRNRTPENEVLLNLERVRLQHMREADSLKAALLFFFFSNFVYSLLRKKARLAALSLLAACSAFVAVLGLPSIPIDWRCCAYWGPGFENGVSKTAVQASAISAWLMSAALFLLSLVIHHRRKLRLSNAKK